VAEHVGLISTVCGSVLIEEVTGRLSVRPNQKKTFTCNRWAAHSGPHKMTDRRTFALVAAWSGDKRLPNPAVSNQQKGK
jgi:hypothetical protein